MVLLANLGLSITVETLTTCFRSPEQFERLYFLKPGVTPFEPGCDTTPSPMQWDLTGKHLRGRNKRPVLRRRRTLDCRLFSDKEKELVPYDRSTERTTHHPLLPEELGQDFSIENQLQFGSLPITLVSQSPRETLLAYAQMYLREEIQAEAQVRNLAGFARFLPVAALFQGQMLNAAGLARDAGVQRTTVNGYLEIMQDTLVAYKIPGYEAKLRVKERKHPKLYWSDLGVLRAVKGQLEKPTHEEQGPLFEGWIANYLRAHKELGLIPYDEICYWSPAQARAEVDFLLRFGKRFVAIEAKAGATYTAAGLSGLRAMDRLAGLKRRILVYQGRTSGKTTDGIEIIPLDEFLSVARDVFGL
jgi:predicted AAA+ superfamily ATPase